MNSRLIGVLRDELQRVIDNIDAGNSRMSEEDALSTIQALQKFSHKDEWKTKYEASKFLKVSRATFDNLVANGILPRGEKRHAGDSNLFWKTTDLMSYMRNRGKKVTNIKG